MLSTSPYRDVTVIDVARLAGTSPATFYQYFSDIETAVIELTTEMTREGANLKALVEGHSWTGKSGYAAAEHLVDGFLEFWNAHEPVLRVVDLAAIEGDKRFGKIRTKMLTAVTTSLADAIAGLGTPPGRQAGGQAKGKAGEETSPMAMAGSLVAMLAAVAAHQKGFEAWDIRSRELRQSLISLVYWGITGKKPPAS